MGEEDERGGEAPVARPRPRRPPARPPPNRPTAYLGVGLVGLLVFLLGVWEPAWSGIAYGVWVSYAVAILGGVLVVFGFTMYWRTRKDRPQRTDVTSLPGVEVYDPNELPERRPDAPVADDAE